MEDNKKPSSLPPNYVTLVQLQERWLKEKEEKQKHKERQDKQKEREKKQKQKPNIQPQNAVARRSRPRSKPLMLGGLERNLPDKSEASVSEVEVGGDNKNVDQEGKSVNSNKKKKKKKKRRNKNYPKKQNPDLVVEERKEITENDGVAHKPPANEGKKDVQGTRNKESRGMEGEFRAKSSSRDLNQTKVEVEIKFRDLSVNDSNGKRCNEMKRTSTYTDRGKRESRDYGSLRQVRNPRDTGLIWVKKGEPFDGNGGRMRALEGSHSVSGLQDDIRFDVNIKQPRTLARTTGVAQLLEGQNQLQKRQSRQYRFLLNPSLYTTPTTSRRITNQNV